MNALIKSLKLKYLQLPLREQGFLAAACIFICLYLIFILIVQPINESRDRLQQRNAVNFQTLREVTELVDVYKQANKNGNLNQNISLPQLVDQTIRQQQLTMTRFQPGSRNDATLRLENVPFDNVLKWFSELELTHKITIKEANITQGKSRGLVNVSLKIQGATTN